MVCWAPLQLGNRVHCTAMVDGHQPRWVKTISAPILDVRKKKCMGSRPHGLLVHINKNCADAYPPIIANLPLELLLPNPTPTAKKIRGYSGYLDRQQLFFNPLTTFQVCFFSNKTCCFWVPPLFLLCPPVKGSGALCRGARRRRCGWRPDVGSRLWASSSEADLGPFPAKSAKKMKRNPGNPMKYHKIRQNSVKTPVTYLVYSPLKALLFLVWATIAILLLLNVVLCSIGGSGTSKNKTPTGEKIAGFGGKNISFSQTGLFF